MDWETRTARAARAATNQSGHKGFACNAPRMGWMRHFRASAHIKPTSRTLGNPGQIQQFTIGVYVWPSFEIWCKVCGAVAHMSTQENSPSHISHAHCMHIVQCAWEICEGEFSGSILACIQKHLLAPKELYT